MISIKMGHNIGSNNITIDRHTINNLPVQSPCVISLEFATLLCVVIIILIDSPLRLMICVLKTHVRALWEKMRVLAFPAM